MVLSGPSLYTWSEPSSDAAVLERRSGPSGNQAMASFLATRAGKATVAAVDDPHGYPRCLPPSRSFAVYVSVRG